MDNRVTKSNDINETSSRSHLIFTVRIETTDKQTKETTISKISFIDLAGSEQCSRTGVDKNLYIEGLSINEGNQCLGHVIKQLYDGVPSEEVDYDIHLLPSIMKDSLGGNAVSLMLTNISPSIYNIR